jgi:hypothetical protein
VVDAADGAFLDTNNNGQVDSEDYYAFSVGVRDGTVRGKLGTTGAVSPQFFIEVK